MHRFFVALIPKPLITSKPMKPHFIRLIFFVFCYSFCSQAQTENIENIMKAWAAPSYFPDHVVLSAQQDPAHSIGINWRTNIQIEKGYVEIAEAEDGPNFRDKAEKIEANRRLLNTSEATKDGFEAAYFEVIVSDLKPSTTYAYRVGNTTYKSEWYHFKTQSEIPAPLSFLYVGDAQNYILELWSRVIRTAYQTAPYADFFIHAGDLVNDAHSETQWNEWFAAGGFIHSQIPTIATPGNHEYRGLKKENPKKDRALSMQWKNQFSFPANGPKDLLETCYYVDYPNLRVIALNSNRNIEQQASWLELVLANNPKKWTVVTYHHPVFSASKGRDNKRLRQYWQPLFEKYQVDLALQGHDHSYARGAVFQKPLKMKKNAKNELSGPVYVVSVSGGKMYGVNEKGWDSYGAIRQKKGEQTQLFQHITIEGNQLIYRSFTPTGKLFDYFKLEKQKDKTLYHLQQMNESKN